MAKKVWISVADPRRGGRARRLCWYAGTSDAAVAQSAHAILQLPAAADGASSSSDSSSSSVVLLRDVDGDVVPLSAALPSGASFALVLPERLRDRRLSNGVSVSSNQLAVDASSDTEEEHQAPEEQDEATEEADAARSPAAKRQRTSLDGADDARASTASAADATPSAAATAPPPPVPEPAAAALEPLSVSPSTPLPVLRVALAARRPPTHSVTTMVTLFLDAFTEAIANDDNVNFIPNTGRFALYALYSELVADRAFHPKHQDAFYKITSMQGKVDRQRVNRYYLHAAASSTESTSSASTMTAAPSRSGEVVLYKPQGKGPLLRKYRNASGGASSELVERAGVMASALQLPPALVVDKFLAFVGGFQPISKAEFAAHNAAQRRLARA